jgi:hypothetical protein
MRHGSCGAIRAKEPSWRVTCKQHAIILSLSVEENSKQRIVALCLLTRPSNRAQAGSMMSADDQYSATLTPTRSSNHPLICKIRSRSTVVCSHMRPQCVALEYGLGEAHNAAIPAIMQTLPCGQPSVPETKLQKPTKYTPDCAQCQRRSRHVS